MTHIHILKYYLAIKRNKLWIHTTTWLKLKNIIQCSVKQAINNKPHIINYNYMICPEKADNGENGYLGQI